MDLAIRRIRRAPLRLLLVGLPALLLVACSSSNNNSSSNKPATAVKAASAAAPASAASAAGTAAAAAATKAASAAAVTTAASGSPAAAAPAGPTQSPQAQVQATGSPIKIGVLADLTGAFANEGNYMKLGVDFAIQHINATGGINGHKVEAVYADPKTDPAEAVRLARELVQQDNVDVLVGGVGSNECLAVEQQAPQLGVLYVASTGCASDVFTSTACNKFSFRVEPTANQTTDPESSYLIKSAGPKWGVMYADYAFGQSQLKAYKDSLGKLGGSVTVEIPVPLNESNVSPYVSKIPTDGSINGLVVAFGGADLVRIMGAIQQFGINKKVAISTQASKDFFGGTAPDAVDGSIGVTVHPTDGIPGNTYDAQFDADWHKFAPQERTTIGVHGYVSYMAISAVRAAGDAAKVNGKADTQKWITAFENLNMPQGPDSPTGPMIMNKNDHQGRMNVYIIQEHGQKEDILQTVPASEVPQIGTCQAK
ncbi:MAG TPA: ABC transporter substrate-binding protein [Dehalococcoidia bacterium]|nr:ABC transporter substrate-binding protein [Dehalococcoidia bacterium]